MGSWDAGGWISNSFALLLYLWVLVLLAVKQRSFSFLFPHRVWIRIHGRISAKELFEISQRNSYSTLVSRQEYWSWLPFLSPGDLPNPGTELPSLASPELAGGFFTSNVTWEASVLTGSFLRKCPNDLKIIKSVLRICPLKIKGNKPERSNRSINPLCSIEGLHKPGAVTQYLAQSFLVQCLRLSSGTVHLVSHLSNYGLSF